MQVVFANQPLPPAGKGGIVPNSIFLVGPTPREQGIETWRPQALAKLKAAHFTGHVFVPEDDTWGFQGDYDHQVWWEIEGLGKAAAVACWMDRRIPSMPAFTTNTEVGFLMMAKPERMVIGTPEGAQKVRYQQTLARDIARMHAAFGRSSVLKPIPVVPTMDEMIATAMEIADPRYSSKASMALLNGHTK